MHFSPYAVSYVKKKKKKSSVAVFFGVVSLSSSFGHLREGQKVSTMDVNILISKELHLKYYMAVVRCFLNQLVLKLFMLVSHHSSVIPCHIMLLVG